MSDTLLRPPARKRRWLILTLVLGVVGILAVLLGSAVQKVRTAANRMADA